MEYFSPQQYANKNKLLLFWYINTTFKSHLVIINVEKLRKPLISAQFKQCFSGMLSINSNYRWSVSARVSLLTQKCLDVCVNSAIQQRRGDGTVRNHYSIAVNRTARFAVIKPHHDRKATVRSELTDTLGNLDTHVPRNGISWNVSPLPHSSIPPRPRPDRRSKPYVIGAPNAVSVLDLPVAVAEAAIAASGGTFRWPHASVVAVVSIKPYRSAVACRRQRAAAEKRHVDLQAAGKEESETRRHPSSLGCLLLLADTLTWSSAVAVLELGRESRCGRLVTRRLGTDRRRSTGRRRRIRRSDAAWRPSVGLQEKRRKTIFRPVRFARCTD